MLKKAEEMKKQDEEQLGKINAKNGLESYLFAIKNSVSDSKLEGKIQKEDKEKILKAVDDGLKWMNDNKTASKEEYEKKGKKKKIKIKKKMKKEDYLKKKFKKCLKKLKK